MTMPKCWLMPVPRSILCFSFCLSSEILSKGRGSTTPREIQKICSRGVDAQKTAVVSRSSQIYWLGNNGFVIDCCCS